MFLGLAYFVVLLWPALFSEGVVDAELGHPLIRVGAPMVLAIYASWWWLWGGHTEALSLTPAQVQMLVPAPIRRADLIRFRLLQTQIAIIPTAAILSYLFGMHAVPWPLGAVGLWMLLTTLHLHQAAASLVHASALRQGTTGLRRNRIPIAFFVVAFSALLWTLFQPASEFRAAQTIEDVLAGVQAALSTPLAQGVLFPFDLVLAPFLAEGVASWIRAAAAAFVVLVLHYWWVIRTDAAFEEAAEAAGRKRAERRAAMRSGRRSKVADAHIGGDRPAIFPLRPTGHPAVALLWKNSVSFSRQMQVASPVFVVAVLVILYLFVVILTGSPKQGADAIGLILVASGGMLTALGPMAIRNDLRDDMARLDVLRSYPLPASALVAAEVAASTISLTVLQLVLFGAGIVCLWFGEIADGRLLLLLYGYVAALVILPAVNGIAMVIQNASVLLFPGWVRPSGRESGGVETIGQQLMVISFTMPLLALSLVFPAAVAGTVLMRLGFGVALIVIAVVAALGTLWSELLLAFTLLGETFERTDTSQITA